MTVHIYPTVGRMLHYYPEAGNTVTGPLAAIITEVHDEKTVGVHVLGPRGNRHFNSPARVRLRQPEDDQPSGNHPHCEWIPFQIEDEHLKAPLRQRPEPNPMASQDPTE